MATYAGVEDVRKRLGRPIVTDAEREQVTTWLEDIESHIRGKLKDLDDLVDSGRLARDSIVRAEATAVVRKVENPRGVRSETKQFDDYQKTETRDRVVSDGQLRLTAEEWDDLLGEITPIVLAEGYTIDLGTPA
ncbi:Gp19/Gp15/Gp42 family protein [Oerskovia paurometabola]|uniref:Gp19/Gp15/Gp42 family protein n=1 Tax=Oerskovia paurometabola TaxID=162170 RepID=A0ABW1XBI7_9CELL|nr:Gp19/Gp15/Gp42 family protein [Oerskovia paurometabola]MBM7497803.1 hypothetical protein [Oerskovia paurometabola]